MKKIFWIILILCLLWIVYVALGWFGIIPTEHCGVAMGPNGPVEVCDWYAGIGEPNY